MVGPAVEGRGRVRRVPDGVQPARGGPQRGQADPAQPLEARSALPAQPGGRYLTWVWPFVPMRPNRTVTVEPARSISQNLLEPPPTKVNERPRGS